MLHSPPPPGTSFLDHFVARFEHAAVVQRIGTPGCWLWCGKLGSGGYPSGQQHQLAAKASCGPPPPAESRRNPITASHLCGVRNCVCPQHVRWETNSQNMRRNACQFTQVSAKCDGELCGDSSCTRVVLEFRAAGPCAVPEEPCAFCRATPLAAELEDHFHFVLRAGSCVCGWMPCLKLFHVQSVHTHTCEPSWHCHHHHHNDSQW